MKNVLGAIVIGEDFYGREEERGNIKMLLRSGNHVLLSAPRRVGKSSLMGAVCDDLRQEGWIIIEINVQSASNEEHFLEMLKEGAKQAGIKLPIRVSAWSQKIRKLSPVRKGKTGSVEMEIGGESFDWHTYTEAFESAFASVGKRDTKILIAIDELPIFLGKLAPGEGGKERIRVILDWLRALRTTPNLQMVLCGSIGLESVVERHGLAGTINDLASQPLGAYPDFIAIDFLRKLASDHHSPFVISEEAGTAILADLGWAIPYYLQLMFYGLTQLDSRHSSPDFPTLQDVTDAYNRLLDIHEKGKFTIWDSRLDEQFNDMQNIARARRILAHLATKKKGALRKAIITMLLTKEIEHDAEIVTREGQRILDVLEYDGYLQRTGDTYSFRSFLLRDYWRKYHA
jgi:uncharacterized protein